MPRIGALILAAGGSVRMGTPKQLIQWQNQSLIRRVAQVALSAGCESVRVVIGSSADLVRSELSELPVEIVENAEWAKGMGTSIRAGMRDLPDAIDAILILLCDQPLITADHLRSLIDASEQSGKPLAACAYPDGTIGTPALFSRPFFDDLRGLSNDTGAKKILAQHRDRLAAVPIAEAVVDLDTFADIESLKREIHE